MFMSEYAGFWSHTYLNYALTLRTGFSPYSAVGDDIASLLYLTGFSVIQGYIASQLFRNLRRTCSRAGHGSDSTNKTHVRFAVASMALFVFYLIGTILAVTLFASKLFVAKRVEEKPQGASVEEWRRPGDWCLLTTAHIEDCTWFRVPVPTTHILWVNSAMTCFFELVILVADGLLLHRCYVAFKHNRWVYGFGGITYFLSMLSCIGFVVYTFKSTQGLPNVVVGTGSFVLDLVVVLAIGCSTLVNLVATVSITFRLVQAKRQFRIVADPDDASYDPYRMAIFILLEAALPPAFFGILICIITLPLNKAGIHYTYSLRTLWLSCTALAPQLIALRALQGRSWNQRPENEASVPLAFVTVSRQTSADPDVLNEQSSQTEVTNAETPPSQSREVHLTTS